VILATAIVWGTADLVFFGARPIVMSLVTAVFLSPAALRFDEARRAMKGQDKEEEL
jgi:hypothetical protein